MKLVLNEVPMTVYDKSLNADRQIVALDFRISDMGLAERRQHPIATTFLRNISNTNQPRVFAGKVSSPDGFRNLYTALRQFPDNTKFEGDITRDEAIDKVKTLMNENFPPVSPVVTAKYIAPGSSPVTSNKSLKENDPSMLGNLTI
ncbi:MAG TPA: hypothetical protein VI522_07745 [Gammaproteobacteria bacterium]|nr:hypothetical protein [Gammaproteobacteria bacterium]